MASGSPHSRESKPERCYAGSSDRTALSSSRSGQTESRTSDPGLWHLTRAVQPGELMRCMSGSEQAFAQCALAAAHQSNRRRRPSDPAWRHTNLSAASTRLRLAHSSRRPGWRCSTHVSSLQVRTKKCRSAMRTGVLKRCERRSCCTAAGLLLRTPAAACELLLMLIPHVVLCDFSCVTPKASLIASRGQDGL